MRKRSSETAVYPHDTDVVHASEIGAAGGFAGAVPDLRQILRFLQRRFPVLFGITLLGAALAIIHAVQQVPLYSATTTLLVDARQTRIIESEEVLSGIGLDTWAIESELELIRSAAVAKQVVLRLGLDKADKPPEAGGGSLLSRLRALFLKAEPTIDPPAVETDNDDRIMAIVQGIRGGLRARLRGQSYLIDVSYISPDPAMAAKLANAFAEEYLVNQLEAKFEATRRANEWLNSRLSVLRDNVRTAERAVEAYRAENDLVEAKGTTLSEQQIANFNEQLILARAETAEAQAKLEQLHEITAKGGEVTSFADQLQSGVIAGLRARQSELKRERAELGSKYGSRHPAVTNVNAQIRDINRQIKTEINRITALSENAYRIAKSREESIALSLLDLEGQASVSNQAEIQLRELEREAEASRTLFESFLARFKETEQQESLQTAESRIIDRATVPTFPSHPNKRAIVLLGLIVSFAAATGVAILLDHLDNGIRSGEQAEALVGAPLLATVPSLGRPPRLSRLSGLIERLPLVPAAVRRAAESTLEGERHNARQDQSRQVLDDPFSHYTEAVRSLRMGIRYANFDDQAKVVMLTSALPGEGKSTLASNLALHAANTGEKVLMIDMDLRHPVLTGLQAPDAGAGLVELLTGRAEISKVVRIDRETGLRFIPATHPDLITHTAEVLSSQKVRDFLAQVRQIFDLVVIDSAPLLPVVDSRGLISAVDSVVMVVQWEATSQDAVRSAMRQSYGLEEKLAGVVINNVDMHRARYYDYYKSGYYMTEYAGGYGTAGN